MLNDAEHNEKIKEAIQQAAHQNPEASPSLQWEMIKIKAIETSISYSRIKAQNRHKELKDISDQIERLTNFLEMSSQEQCKEYESKIQSLNNQYDKLMKVKFHSSVFRSKCQFYSQGERSSKYYFGLEKHKYNKKNMMQILDSEGQLQSNPKKILDIQAAFFSHYTRKTPR